MPNTILNPLAGEIKYKVLGDLTNVEQLGEIFEGLSRTTDEDLKMILNSIVSGKPAPLIATDSSDD